MLQQVGKHIRSKIIIQYISNVDFRCCIETKFLRHFTICGTFQNNLLDHKKSFSWPQYYQNNFVIALKDLLYIQLYIGTYMRIFVTTPDETGTNRKTRLTLVDCNTTNQLLKRISALCNMQHNWLIVKLKQDIFNIRIVEGWPLEIYPIRQGSEIQVQVLPEGLKLRSPVSSSPKLVQIDEEMQLELEDNNTTGLADQKFSFYSDSNEHDWTKYFEDSLQQFLNAVRNQSIQQANNILKAEPEVNDEKILVRIMNKKVKFLLNETGQCGRSALHWAVQDKNLDMVQFLLIKSCDPNIVSVDQYTPLQLAIVLRASSIFQTLAAHPRIDLNKVTKKGTALHIAIQNSQPDYAQKLLDLGANPQTQNFQGISATELSKTLKSPLKQKKTTQNPIQFPHIMRGNLSRVSSFASRLKQRTLLINPFTNEFIIFEQKNVENNLMLKDINSVIQIQDKDKSWGMKKQYFYFEIVAFDFQVVFCVRNQLVGRAWVEGLKKCVGYCKGIKDKASLMIPFDQQYIQILDDQANSVKVHKRKSTKPVQKQNPRQSKKLNLMDLNPIPDPSIEQPISSPLSPSVKKTPILNQVQTSRTPQKQEVEIIPFDLPHISPIQQPDIDYLRDSELLGSVLSNQFMTKSILGRGDSMRLSAFCQEGTKPIVGIKDFQILRQLGNGSFGRVFLARHRKQQKLYALKVLNKKKLIAKKQLKYAVGEANILKKVQSPFIIKLYFSFQTPSNLYIAIDYCPNGDLTEIMLDQERMSEKVCRFYIAQIILAIEYLHKNKIMYRDLKPENILLGQDGYIRLTDFNLSKQNNFSMSFCGSPAYLSPEMLEKKGVGFQADIYGIGCVFYEMLVGQPPFFDQNIDNLYQNIRTGKLKFPSYLSKPSKSLISGLLQRNISKRIGVRDFSEIKQHEFFTNFEWQKLQKMEMKLPIEIESKIQEKANSLQVIKDHGFKDSDYESSTSMMNRIKNFTFVRDAKLYQE